MDPVSLAYAAGSALVGAMATDTWQQARSAVAALWRRARPERVQLVEEDLAEVRGEVLAAREIGDTAAEEGLAQDWGRQLQRLLRNPGVAEELEQVLEDVLIPALGPGERDQIWNQINVARGGQLFAVQRGNLYHRADDSPLPRNPEADDDAEGQ